jgi:hypothetical protein
MARIPKTATLNEGQVTRLHFAVAQRCTVAVTSVGEFETIQFQTRTRGGLVVSDFVEAREASLRFGQTLPFAIINGTTPPGVGQLDIEYEVRTRGDA